MFLVYQISASNGVPELEGILRYHEVILCLLAGFINGPFRSSFPSDRLGRAVHR